MKIKFILVLIFIALARTGNCVNQKALTEGTPEECNTENLALKQFAAPQNIAAFLDDICSRYQIIPGNFSDLQILADKLARAGFKLIRKSLTHQKIVAMLPPPYDKFLVKINCSPQSGQINCSRVFIANQIRDIITQQKLNYLHIPQKYLYKLPVAPSVLLDLNYFVLVEKLSLNYKKLIFSMPNNALHQLYIVMRKAYYFDHGYKVDFNKKITIDDFNICLDTNNRIVFIDTEDCNIRGNINSINIGRDIKKITNLLEREGCIGLLPREAFLGHILISTGELGNDQRLIKYGKNILRILYTAYCGFFPFVVLNRTLT